MVKLEDLFDMELFIQMREEGYIRTQTLDNSVLGLAGYTEKAQFDRVWNDVTLNCRGLIWNIFTHEIRARPFRKFFNYGEPEAAHLELDEPVEVTDKMDGSLGILYPYDGGYQIATRGSFQSEQAIHATKVWKERYEGRFVPVEGFTYLFEIIYPENRIVLNYGDMDDLVLIGIIENSTGQSIPNPAKVAEWPGLSATVFEYATLAEALQAEPRPNAEGLVVHFLKSDDRVKLKQEDYVALHKIVTGLSARTVWQHLMDAKPLEELVAPLPDEFHDWVKEVWEGLCHTVSEQETAIHREYESLIRNLPMTYSRKDFALEAVRSPNKWALFAIEDGKEIWADLLKRAKPEATTPSGKLVEELENV